MRLEIITPEALAWSCDEVVSVIVPTAQGKIDILPGHIPLTTIVKAGDLTVKSKNPDKIEHIAVDNGYCRVLGDLVSILTQAAINVEDIDLEQIAKAEEKAKKAIDEAKNKKIYSTAEMEKFEAITRFSVAQRLAKSKIKK